jgi:hypothetical protein
MFRAYLIFSGKYVETYCRFPRKLRIHLSWYNCLYLRILRICVLSLIKIKIRLRILNYGRSQWPRDLRPELSSFAGMLRSWVRIPLKV